MPLSSMSVVDKPTNFILKFPILYDRETGLIMECSRRGRGVRLGCGITQPALPTGVSAFM